MKAFANHEDTKSTKGDEEERSNLDPFFPFFVLFVPSWFILSGRLWK